MIRIFKLFTAPLLTAALIWAIRRFKPALVGLLRGVPLRTGPISAIVARELKPLASASRWRDKLASAASAIAGGSEVTA